MPSYGLGASSPLVPSLDINNSFQGQTSSVTYPVHKSLVYCDTLQQLIMTNHEDEESEIAMIHQVVDGSWAALQTSSKEDSAISPINLSLGEVAVDSFRQSLENSVKFEHAWFDSGMPAIASWLVEGTSTPPHTLKPSVWRLSNLILRNAFRKIQESEATKTKEAKTTSISTASLSVLEQGVSYWAESAHNELRNRLDGAFASKSWNKTRWWKLLWRVDEVGLIATDLLQRAWLVDAEKEMIWMFGRVHQSGILGAPKLELPPAKSQSGNEDTRTVNLADLVDQITPFEESGEEKPVFNPWPQDIYFARTALIRNTIPPLQAFGQKLLLQSVSTTILTSSLSALMYLSVSATGFEAGAIAAIGFAFSLRRLQTQWERARKTWEITLKEDGKDILRRAEATFRVVLQTDTEPRVDPIEMEQIEAAKRAAHNAKVSLDVLSRGIDTGG